jgi:hypothetical protein
MYTEAFGYPFEGDDATKRLLVGSGIVFSYGLIYVAATLLSLVLIGFLLYPLLLLPVLLLYGYMMDVFDVTVEGGVEPPPFDDWGELLTQGVRMFGLVFVYQLPVFAVLIVGFLLVFGLSAAADPAAADPTLEQASGLVAILLFVLGTVVWLAVTYLLPAALCSAAQDRSFTAGFDLDRIKGACLSADYAIGWLLAGGVYLILGTIGFLFSVVLIGIPIVFYTVVVMARLIAIGYREGLGIEPADDTASDDGSGPDEETPPTETADTQPESSTDERIAGTGQSDSDDSLFETAAGG